MNQITLADLKVGFEILKSNFNSLLRNPYKLTFAVTYQCNLRCKTCLIWKKKTKNELTLEEIEKFSKKSNFFSWINVTGGEPFLRKDIVEIARAFSENSKYLSLFNTTTNGYLTDRIYEKAQELLRLKIPKTIIVVSLDGPEKTHDKIKGVDGSWKKALKTYQLLKELEKENNKFKTFLGYTISPLNLGEFLETYHSVKKIIPHVEAKDFHVNLFHLSEHYFSNVNENFSLENHKKSTLSELQIIEKMKGRKLFYPIFFLEQMYLKLGKEFFKINKTPLPCKALLTSVFIDPTGGVYPCTIFNKKLGNLRNINYDLEKILTLQNTKKIKEDIEKLNCPNCWTPCESYQTILGNLFNQK